MKQKLPVLISFEIISALCVWAQPQAQTSAQVPIYRVTVTERTVEAVNYQYRAAPTQIDFRGTVLMPEARGEAIIQSKAGRTEIDAKLDRLRAPTRFGAEYLTYTLWAITPEGHAKNLGEVVAGGSDKAKMRVTTDLQAFGLIVTAEPYSAVRLPSDVVVMENKIRPDTIGRIEPIMARYELLPRGHYTYELPVDLKTAEGSGPKVPFDRYEALLEVYQAQNAVQIASSAGADQYAADTFKKAQALLSDAQSLESRRAGRSNVVTVARQAAQTAEDARAIALKRKQDEEIAQAHERAARAEAARAAAEAAAQQARAQASADRVQLDDERAARERAEAAAAAASAGAALQPLTEAQPIPTPVPRQDSQENKTELRMRLFQEFTAAGEHTRDTPRGLVVMVPDHDFRGAMLNSGIHGGVARLGSAIAARPGLRVEVEGHSDANGAAERIATERAEAVRDILVRNGVPANAVFVRGMGNSRPLVANTTASNREQNRRVEIIVTGEPIGTLPYWDKTYSLR